MILFFNRNKLQLTVLAVFVFAFSLLPIFDVYHAVGNEWRGIPPAYSDEDYYYARIKEVVDGYPFIGNPYFYEHRSDPAPTFFVADWLAAAPLILGASLPMTLIFNFSLWSLIFALLVFLIFLEVRLHKNFAAIGAFLVYVQSYYWILRPVSLQQVFPFFLLFILSMLYWYRAPDRRATKIFLASAAGATFYIYTYLWQIVVVALLALVSILLVRRDWPRLRSLVLPSALSLLIALPAILYTAIQLKHQFYWQTVERIGLVYSHLPTAEVMYSGGWIILTLIAFLFVLKRVTKADISVFVALSALGVALVCVQASNIITGKEVETAVHVKRFIIPWLGISFGAIIAWLFQGIPDVARQSRVRWVGCLLVLVLGVGNLYFVKDFPDFFTSPARDARTQKLQTLAAPLQFLEKAETSPVVVWVTDPESDFAYYLPALTKHYVLYTHPGMWHLVSNDEIKERYLTANYLHSVTKESLIEDLDAFAGPATAWHQANTVNRGVRLCELFRLESFGYSCGSLTTTEELLGETYFNDFLTYNTNDVRPHIRELLEKYHVSYIASSEPLSLAQERFFGAQLVYRDQRYVIYRTNVSVPN